MCCIEFLYLHNAAYSSFSSVALSVYDPLELKRF